MVSARRGAGSLGCLFTLLIVAALVYFGLPIGEAYFRYYRFEDEMRQSARFARVTTDDAIKRKLSAFADSIGLPAEAQRIQVRRANGRIAIGAAYDEEFHLPGYVRVQAFTPRVEDVY